MPRQMKKTTNPIITPEVLYKTVDLQALRVSFFLLDRFLGLFCLNLPEVSSISYRRNSNDS